MKRRIAVLLCMALILTLCSCSNEREISQNEQPETEAHGAAEAPALTHAADFKPIKGKENSFSPQLYTADGIYCTVGETVEAAVTESGGTHDRYRTTLLFIDYDGNEQPLPDFKPLDPGQCGLLIPERAQDTSQSTEIRAVIDAGDGRIVLLESVYISYLDEQAAESGQSDDSRQSMEKTFLRIIGRTGAEESCQELILPFNGDFSAVNGAVFGGQLVCAMGNSVVVFGLDGTFLYALDSHYRIDRILVIEDSLYALGSFDERTDLVGIDLIGRGFGEITPLELDGWDFTVGGGEYDLYSNTGTSLMGYDLETGKAEEVLSWLSCSINGYDLSTYAVREDGSVVTVESRWDRAHTTCENHVVILHAEAKEASPQEEIVLTLACKYLGDALAQAVSDFNRENEHCRIEVIDYSKYNQEGDWNAGVTRLNTQIMAGDVPDILVLDGLPAKQYAARGLLADLYPFLEADPELDRDDFFDSILRACEQDGKLYTSVSGFSIDTCIGASDVAGDQPGWNYQEFAQALASMPEGCTPFNQFTTRDTVLFYILALELDRFVDWGAGKCCFDSPAFLELLEFAKTFPETAVGGYTGTEDSEPSRIASGKQMLLRSGIYCFSDFQMIEAMFGGNCTYIGYPTSVGNGNMIQLDAGCAISAACRAPEAAWKFVRTFFTADYQRSLAWSLPSNREIFNEKLREIMTPVYLQDENGRYVVDETGSRIETDQGSVKFGDVVIGYRALTETQAEKILSLVESTERLYGYDENFADIITEEAAAFFYGQKSAAEAAELIQRRAELYISEQQ